MMRQLHKKPNSHVKVRGFEHLVISAFSLCLLIVLVLLPLAPAFASDDSIEEVTIETQTNVIDTDSVELLPEEVVTDEVNLPVEIETSDSDATLIAELPLESVPENILTEDIESFSDSSEAVSPVNEVLDTEEEAVTVTTEAQPATSTEILLDEVASLDNVSSSTEEETLVEESIIDDEIEIANNEEDLTSDDEVVNASTSLPLGELASVNVVTTDENRFSFAKGECASVGDEMFYCAKADAATTTTHTDRVFAAPDAEGDKEIYIEKDGVVAPISNNAIDDDAPYYDVLSDSIVWHRLIDGRYQIVSYDVDSEDETQLTSDRYNNMAPSRYDNLTVWQGWVGNDWEIFLLQDNELMMITDNTTHDIAPSVNGTHIIWQSFETGVWQMKVYDIRTKQVSTIEDTDGGSVENPRFVLVYDTKFESGDVETRGYDLVSGEVIALGATPTSVPQEIPDPDQTGEERALVSPQTQPKTKVDEGEDDMSGTGGDVPEDDVLDIVIPALQGTSTDVMESTSTPIVNDTDVIVPALVIENATSTEHIEDIIITPYVEPISTEDDAQQVIVSGS